MLTFIIPVRDQRSIADWAPVKARMAETFASVANQKHPDWELVVVATEGTDLPDLPANGRLVEAALPYAEIPRGQGKRARLEVVRLDKGKRIMLGAMAARPGSHLMFVDYDDLVSDRLAGTCARDPDANGWFMADGFLFSGGGEISLFKGRFSGVCGTSIIIHSRLLSIPERLEEAEDGYMKEWMGSHRFAKPRLAAAGTPLRKLPYPGAAYRVGHPESDSGSGGVAETLLRISEVVGGAPPDLERLIGPETDEFRREFRGPAA